MVSNIPGMTATSRLCAGNVFPVLVMCSLFLISTASSQAQERKPVATLCLAGIDRLVQDIEYIGKLSDRDWMSQTAHDILIALGGLEGIDRSRPLGVLLYVQNPGKKDPDGLIAIPVSSREGFRRLLGFLPNIKIVVEESPDILEVQTSDKRLKLRFIDGYAVVSESQELVEGDLGFLAKDLADRAQTQDVSLTLHRSGVPENLLSQVKAEFPEKLRREAEYPEGETEEQHEFRRRLVELSIHIGGLFLEGIEEIELGLNLSPDEEGARFLSRVVTQPDAELTQRLVELRGEGQAYGHMTDRAALILQWNVVLPQPVRSLLTGIVEERSRSLRREIGNAVRPDDKEPLTEALVALTETMKQGKLQGMVGFVGNRQSHMTVVLSSWLAEPAALEKAFKTLLPYAQVSGDIREADLNLDAVAETSIHRIQGKPSREQDRKLFGGDPSMYIALGEPVSWLAVGMPFAADILKNAIPEAGRNTTDRSLLKGELHVTPWIPLIAADGNDEQLVEALNEAFPGPVPDRIQGALTTDETGLQLTLTADESYLHFLGIVISRATGR